MNTPPPLAPMRALAAVDADARARAGTLTIIDVRPPEERALAAIAAPHDGLEDGGLERLLALPRQTPLAFLCHHGARSAQGAQYFRTHGFAEVYNITGGIEAWSIEVDPTVPRY